MGLAVNGLYDRWLPKSLLLRQQTDALILAVDYSCVCRYANIMFSGLLQMDSLLKIAGTLAALLVVLSSIPGPTWPLKFRICVVVLLGMIVLGFLAWPIVAPTDPYGIISMPGLSGTLVLMLLALVTGLAGYFLTWPYGEHLAVIAVPAGMAVWSARSGVLADALTGTTDAVQRAELFHSLLPRPFFWLFLAAVGLAGMFIGRFILPSTSKAKIAPTEPKLKLSSPANAVTAFIGSVFIAFIGVVFFAQNIRLEDVQLGQLIVQPSAGQVGFAVFVAFALASFLCSKFLGALYFLPAAATAIVSVFGLAFYNRTGILEYLALNWPSNFFVNPLGSILPVQMVSFGILGAAGGFWLVKSFDFWRSFQEQPAQ